MILEIRLSNFFSIKNEVVLDMRAGNGKSAQMQRLLTNTFSYNDEQILKSAAIYGANASGKSNIIKAIRFCVSTIWFSHTNNENVIFDFVPFKFDGYQQKPSNFFIRFVIKGIEYEYSFSLTQKEIISEELYYYPNGRRAKIFTRNENNGTTKSEIYSFASAIRKPLDVAENTSRKTLYISRASQMDREIPKTIFRFFAEKIYIGYHTDTSIIERLFQFNKDVLLKALQIADSDIVDIRMLKQYVPAKTFSVDMLENKAKMEDAVQTQLIFLTYHKRNPKVPFNLTTEESAGTVLLFYMMLTIIDAVKNNKIFIIDELGISLHTKITEYILNLFHASDSAQIIYTTHNTNLLDFNILRKDQIYFVNKKDDGSSDLYSLFDYKDFRDTMDVEKAYLQGRFDAIPYINDSAENLKTIIQ